MNGDVGRTTVEGALNDHGLVLIGGVVPQRCVLKLGHHLYLLLNPKAPARDAVGLPLVVRVAVVMRLGLAHQRGAG